MIIQLTTDILNDSLQIGDVVFARTHSAIGSLRVANMPMRVGVIEDIGVNTITITDPPDHVPAVDDFVMFSKDKQINNTSLLGYYAEVKLTNNSIEEAELFALSSEVAPSSK